MITFTLVALILGFLIAFALLLSGYWQAPEALRQGFITLLRTRKTPAHLPFRAWVETDLADHPGLQGWLLALPEAGLRPLTQRVAGVCADLNIQLVWLTEQHLDVAPPVRLTVRRVVVDYLELCHHAFQQRRDLALFDQYYKLVANPGDNRYLDLRRKYFNRLTALGLAQPLPPYELVMASELERQTLAANAIRAAAAQDWNACAQVLADLLEGRVNNLPV